MKESGLRRSFRCLQGGLWGIASFEEEEEEEEEEDGDEEAAFIWREVVGSQEGGGGSYIYVAGAYILHEAKGTRPGILFRTRSIQVRYLHDSEYHYQSLAAWSEISDCLDCPPGRALGFETQRP